MGASLELNLERKLHKSVLVVGPDAILAQAIAKVLPGWHVESAESNHAALAKVKEATFDVIITGEDTTAKTDLELLRKIRAVKPHTRLIILTNETTPADVVASIREHAFSYFSTPFSDETLAEMIRLAAEQPSCDDGIEVLSATTAWIRLLARCDRKTADRLAQFLHELIDLPECERGNLGTAFREMLLNAIEHGGRFDPTQYVEISYVRARHAVMCRVKDPGEGFSLEEIKHAAIANPPDDPLRHQAHRDAQGLRPGGFGLLITSRLVDELIYGERGNEVLLIKYLDLPERPVAE